MVNVSEAAAVGILAYFSEVEAKEVLIEQMEESEEENESGRTVVGTWADVCNALLRRFLTEEVVRQSYD